MKRFLSLTLSAALLLGLISGCGPADGADNGDKGSGETAMGRYVETQGEVLEGVDRVYDFKSTPDGGATFFGSLRLDEKAVYNRYTVPAGGGPITAEEVPGVADFAPNGVQDMAESADGTLFLLYHSENGFQGQVAKAAPGGAFTPIEVADLKSTGGGVSMGGTVNIGGGVSIGGGTTGKVDISVGDAPTPGGGITVTPRDDGVTYNAEESPAPTEGDDVATDSGNSFSFGEVDAQTKYASGILPTEDGGFIVLYGNDGASRYAADGTLRAEYAGNAYGVNPLVSGSTLMLAAVGDDTAVWSYDLSTDKQDGTYTFESANFSTKISMDGENLYMADASGIYRQPKGSTLWEKLVDGDLTSLVMPNLNVSAFAPDGKGGFLALLGSNDSVQLMRYSYSPDTPTNPDTELTIFGLNDNATVRQAIGEFQRRNPNVRVNFQVGMEGGTSATTEDVIRTLNTELLAGKGPDLILLDGLNIDSYIEKGVLADITDLVTTQEGLLTNLMNAYEKDGKRYGVPSRFKFPVMMGKSADVDAVNALDDLVAKVAAGQGDEIPFLRPSTDLWLTDGVGSTMDFYDVSAGQWMADGVVDEAALAAWFAAVQSLDKTLKEHTPQLDGSIAFVTMATSVAGGIGGFEQIDTGASDLKAGKASFHTQEMSGMFGISFLSQNLAGMEGIKLAPLFGRNVYTPKGGVGLNAAGKQQELAGEFVKMLLSPLVQDSYLYDGYPVNANSLDKLVAEALKDESGGDLGLVALCGKLDTPLLSDQVIKDAVQAQMKGLADGSVTPEQAAADVVEKTRLYLAE